MVSCVPELPPLATVCQHDRAVPAVSTAHVSADSGLTSAPPSSSRRRHRIGNSQLGTPRRRSLPTEQKLGPEDFGLGAAVDPLSTPSTPPTGPPCNSATHHGESLARVIPTGPLQSGMFNDPVCLVPTSLSPRGSLVPGYPHPSVIHGAHFISAPLQQHLGQQHAVTQMQRSCPYVFHHQPHAPAARSSGYSDTSSEVSRSSSSEEGRDAHCQSEPGSTGEGSAQMSPERAAGPGGVPTAQQTNMPTLRRRVPPLSVQAAISLSGIRMGTPRTPHTPHHTNFPPMTPHVVLHRPISFSFDTPHGRPAEQFPPFSNQPALSLSSLLSAGLPFPHPDGAVWTAQRVDEGGAHLCVGIPQGPGLIVTPRHSSSHSRPAMVYEGTPVAMDEPPAPPVPNVQMLGLLSPAPIEELSSPDLSEPTSAALEFHVGRAALYPDWELRANLPGGGGSERRPPFPSGYESEDVNAFPFSPPTPSPAPLLAAPPFLYPTASGLRRSPQTPDPEQPPARSQGDDDGGATAEKTSQASSRSMRTPVRLFVGRIPKSYRSSDLKKLFEGVCEILECNVIRDRNSVQSKGCGFVRVPSVEDAQGAIAALNQACHLDSDLGLLQVKFASGELKRLGLPLSLQPGGECVKVFFGNLVSTTTEDEVREMFARFGDFEELCILRDKNHRSKCSGFITFRSLESAQACIGALNGQCRVTGATRCLEVRLAESRAQRGQRRATASGARDTPQGFPRDIVPKGLSGSSENSVYGASELRWPSYPTNYGLRSGSQRPPPGPTLWGISPSAFDSQPPLPGGFGKGTAEPHRAWPRSRRRGRGRAGPRPRSGVA